MSNNKNQNYNDILFFKIWRNIYLKTIIIENIKNKLYIDNYSKSYCTRYSLINEKFRRYITKIEYSSNEELFIGDFEEGTQIIKITNSLRGDLVPGVIPLSCRSLEFREYNRPLQVGLIPVGVRKLSFGTYFTQSLGVGVLPDSITELIFGGYFNSNLSKGVIPNSVTTLKINCKVQQGGYSKQLIKGSIPDSVKELVLNAQNLLLTKDSFPCSISKLYMYGTLAEPIKANILPQSLTKLSINNLKGSIIKYSIPNSVSRLSFKLFYEDLIQPQTIPNSVTTLKVSNLSCLTFGSIPKSVINLKLKDRIGTDNEFSLVKELSSLNSVSSLFSKFATSLFGTNSNNNSDSNEELYYERIIPNSVQHLTYDIYRQLKRNEIPSSVTNLVFGPSFVYEVIAETIPSSVKTITLSKLNKLNKSLNEKLPSVIIIYK